MQKKLITAILTLAITACLSVAVFAMPALDEVFSIEQNGVTISYVAFGDEALNGIQDMEGNILIVEDGLLMYAVWNEATGELDSTGIPAEQAPPNHTSLVWDALPEITKQVVEELKADFAVTEEQFGPVGFSMAMNLSLVTADTVFPGLTQNPVRKLLIMNSQYNANTVRTNFPNFYNIGNPFLTSAMVAENLYEGSGSMNYYFREVFNVNYDVIVPAIGNGVFDYTHAASIVPRSQIDSNGQNLAGLALNALCAADAAFAAQVRALRSASSGSITQQDCSLVGINQGYEGSSNQALARSLGYFGVWGHAMGGPSVTLGHDSDGARVPGRRLEGRCRWSARGWRGARCERGKADHNESPARVPNEAFPGSVHVRSPKLQFNSIEFNPVQSNGCRTQGSRAAAEARHCADGRPAAERARRVTPAPQECRSHPRNGPHPSNQKL